MKKILIITKNIIVWLVSIVLVVSILLLIFISFSPIRSFQLQRVMSGSMEPAIKTGSIVLVKQTSIDQIAKGDVISFISSGLPVTHRVYEITKTGGQTKIISKGDANNNPDIDPVAANSILGKVIATIPYLGYLSVWIKTPLGFYLVVIVPAILIIANEMWNIKNVIKNLTVGKKEN